MERNSQLSSSWQRSKHNGLRATCNVNTRPLGRDASEWQQKMRMKCFAIMGDCRRSKAMFDMRVDNVKADMTKKISPPLPTPLVVQYDDVIWCQYRITGILDALPPSSLSSIHSPTHYWLLHKTHIPFTFDPTRRQSRGGRSDRTTTSHCDDVTFFSFRFLLFCFIIARPRVGSIHFDMNAIFQH